MAQYPPGGFDQWLQALSYTLSRLREIAIIGEPGSDDTEALLSVVQSGYRPFLVVALGSPGTQATAVPLLQDRGLGEGHAAACICRNRACRVPVTTPQTLAQLLGVR